MKISFEHWLDNSNLSTHAKNLLHESVVCYKSNANRAALLLSYIGFIEIIRKRLLNSNKPSTITDGEWAMKMQYISDDDIAEQNIFDLLMRSDNKYFKLTDSIRNQIRYWKDRRNDCAHLKTNSISSSHVESFWTFLMDNINKIVVAESHDNLLAKITRHFDETYTPLDSDITPLVHEIPLSVELQDFHSFLLSALEIINRVQEETLFYYLSDDAKFVYIILRDLDERYGEIAKQIILSNDTLQENLFYYYPEYLTYFKDNKEHVRAAWKQNLEKSSTQKCATILLRNSLIPQSELHEFIRDAVLQNKDSIPKDDDLIFLSTYGYRKTVDEILDDATKKGTSYSWWVTANKKFIKFYIKYNLIEKNTTFFDMLFTNYTENTSDTENKNIIYSALSNVISESPDFMHFIQERATELSFDLDDILFLF